MALITDDPELEEEFRRTKKRDLFQTYFFKKACRSFGSPKFKQRLIIAPPMHALPVAPGPDLPRTTGGGRSREIKEEQSDEYTHWLRDRRALRKNLEGIGDLDTWFQNKPKLTEMESNVMRRRKQIGLHKTPQVPVALDGQKRVQHTYSVCTPGPKCSKQLQFERKACSSTHRHAMTLKEQEEHHCMECKQDKEVFTQDAHSHLSSLGGPTGSAVDHFREQCVREYLESQERCQRHGLGISSAKLQRGLLHPCDLNMSSIDVFGCKGHRRGWMTYSILPKEVQEEDDTDQEESNQGADPNAFWPGHDGHVRLYLPEMSNRPENVLFHRVERSPGANPGHWPVNQAGYFTSGDINRHKVYIL